jgi:hypothetical protein
LELEIEGAISQLLARELPVLRSLNPLITALDSDRILHIRACSTRTQTLFLTTAKLLIRTVLTAVYRTQTWRIQRAVYQHYLTRLDGDARLEKDYASFEGGYAVAESSDDDDGSSEEDRNRGRMKEIGESDTSEADPESSTLNMGRAKGPRTALSLMAAAEEERTW